MTPRRTALLLAAAAVWAVASWLLTLLHAMTGLLQPWPLKILVDNVLEHHPLPAAVGLLLGPLATDQGGVLLLLHVGAEDFSGHGPVHDERRQISRAAAMSGRCCSAA